MVAITTDTSDTVCTRLIIIYVDIAKTWEYEWEEIMFFFSFLSKKQLDTIKDNLQGGNINSEKSDY